MLRMQASQVWRYFITCILYSPYEKILVICYKVILGFYFFLNCDKGIIYHTDGKKSQKMTGIIWFLKAQTMCLYHYQWHTILGYTELYISLGNKEWLKLWLKGSSGKENNNSLNNTFFPTYELGRKLEKLSSEIYSRDNL